jgi:SPP1 family predicted phage head-tail adaptor
MKKYKISDFKERIDVKYIVSTPDETGGTSSGYGTAYTTFAKVEPYDGDLFLEGGERVLNNKFSFIFRYRTLTSEITKSNKFYYRGDNFIIHSIINIDEDREYIKIIAYKRR